MEEKIRWIMATLFESSINSLMKPEFVSCSDDGREIAVRFKVNKDEINRQGDMHGAYIFAMFDIVFGIITHVHAKDRFITTTESSIKYLKPIKCGDSVLIKAKAVSQGRTLSVLTGEAIVEKTNTIASVCSATFMILNYKKTALAE